MVAMVGASSQLARISVGFCSYRGEQVGAVAAVGRGRGEFPTRPHQPVSVSVPVAASSQPP
jgi:hypothetical protein